MPRRPSVPSATAVLLSLAGCSPAFGPLGECLPERAPTPLPEAIRESSGLAASRRHVGVFWTLDDSGPGVLYAVTASGALLSRIEVPGGLGEDREAVVLGRCATGDCLYVADVGDNQERRTGLALRRLPEPDPAVGTAASPDVFHFSLPEGPRDVEAAFMLPSGAIHLVTKGRNHPPTIYRFPPRLESPVGFLEEVQRLGTGPRATPDQVTGADASPDGAWVLLRSYRSLALHRVIADSLATRPEATVDLRSLGESQGEGVALAPDGRIVLSGEAGPFGRRGSIVVLRCSWTPSRP